MLKLRLWILSRCSRWVDSFMIFDKWYRAGWALNKSHRSLIRKLNIHWYIITTTWEFGWSLFQGIYLLFFYPKVKVFSRPREITLSTNFFERIWFLKLVAIPLACIFLVISKRQLDILSFELGLEILALFDKMQILFLQFE